MHWVSRGSRTGGSLPLQTCDWSKPGLLNWREPRFSFTYECLPRWIDNS